MGILDLAGTAARGNLAGQVAGGQEVFRRGQLQQQNDLRNRQMALQEAALRQKASQAHGESRDREREMLGKYGYGILDYTRNPANAYELDQQGRKQELEEEAYRAIGLALDPNADLTTFVPKFPKVARRIANTPDQGQQPAATPPLGPPNPLQPGAMFQTPQGEGARLMQPQEVPSPLVGAQYQVTSPQGEPRMAPASEVVRPEAPSITPNPPAPKVKAPPLYAAKTAAAKGSAAASNAQANLAGVRATNAGLQTPFVARGEASLIHQREGAAAASRATAAATPARVQNEQQRTANQGTQISNQYELGKERNAIAADANSIRRMLAESTVGLNKAKAGQIQKKVSDLAAKLPEADKILLEKLGPDMYTPDIVGDIVPNEEVIKKVNAILARNNTAALGEAGSSKPAVNPGKLDQALKGYRKEDVETVSYYLDKPAALFQTFLGKANAQDRAKARQIFGLLKKRGK